MNAFVLLFVCRLALGEEVNDDFVKIDEIRQEEPCSGAGGSCTIAADCPPGHLSENRGLCPEQKAAGIECCYGLSMKETRCGKHGGVCAPAARACHARQLFVEATDCPDETRCCVMMS